MTHEMPSLYMRCLAAGFLTAALLAFPGVAAAQPSFGPGGIVQANGVDIAVSGYSVPSFVAWNADALRDLVVGEGGGAAPTGKVRIYLNVGVPFLPQFTGYFYAQSNGADLVVTAGGCLGIFPRVIDANADGKKDLLAGLGDGTVRLYLNINTNDDPRFDGGTFLQVGQPAAKSNINVGGRATPFLADWNNDGRLDLVCGALDGKIRVFINEGTSAAPDYRTTLYAQSSGVDLLVPTGRSSPDFTDLDRDGKKDMLTGNTEGQILFYRNTGTPAAPSFSGYTLAQSDGTAIDLAGSARSRPFVCDWNDDDAPDLMTGAADGLVHLYRGIPQPTDGGYSLAPRPAAELLPCYPNPFNPSVTIPFVLAAPQRVRLIVFDSAGRRVKVIADRSFFKGSHRATWTGIDQAGRPAASGIYFIRLEAGGISSSKKVALVR
jgi:hypothetical protein